MQYLRITCAMLVINFFIQICPTKTECLASAPDLAYSQAKEAYESLVRSSKKRNSRRNWLNVIAAFETAYKNNPKGALADDALYMLSNIYHELHGYSGKKTDLEAAQKYRNLLLKKFPSSSLVSKPKIAQEQGNTIPEPQQQAHSQQLAARSGERIKKGAVNRQKKGEDKTLIKVSGLRFWSNPTYTRVVIDAGNTASYTHRLLKKDVSIKKPERLVLDVENAKLDPKLAEAVPIEDDLLKEARAAQYTPNSVRVVLDIKSISTFNIFSLENPFRIVIDVNSKNGNSVQPPADDNRLEPSTNTLARQLALNIKTIVIDPGHGGKDYGAPGYYPGVHEKDIVLKLAKMLGEKISQKLGCKVIYTRSRDRFIPLEERTAIANTKNADLF
ncbi:MAG: N-acetylmuramoyl-L-alanine amidase, partial [Pseudomonadota bacterium]